MTTRDETLRRIRELDRPSGDRAGADAAAQDPARGAGRLPPASEGAGRDGRTGADCGAIATTCPARWTSSWAACGPPPGGFGFVVPEVPQEDGPGDVYIPAAGLGDAMHGDQVVARIDRVRDGLRPEGRIVRILSRANAIVVGRYDEDAHGHRLRDAVRRSLADRGAHRPRRGRRGASQGRWWRSR